MANLEKDCYMLSRARSRFAIRLLRQRWNPACNPECGRRGIFAGRLHLVFRASIALNRRGKYALRPRSEISRAVHSTPTPFSQGLLDNLAGGGIRRRQIGESSEGAGYSETLPLFHILGVET